MPWLELELKHVQVRVLHTWGALAGWLELEQAQVGVVPGCTAPGPPGRMVGAGGQWRWGLFHIGGAAAEELELGVTGSPLLGPHWWNGWS